MTCYLDLEAIDYFLVDSSVVLRAVGWLGTEFKFSTGKVSQQFFNKLCELAENPFNGVIYVSPELIVHYINMHHYLPPVVFLDAVMQRPDMQSMDYKKSLLKNGGRGLSKLAKP